MSASEGEYDFGLEFAVVCTEHLRFIPCRWCAPGREKSLSRDPGDVRRVMKHQLSQESS